MSITLIAVVVALVLGHAAPALTGLRQYDWYTAWTRWLDARLGDGGFWRGRWGVVLALLPPLLVVVLFQAALDAPLLGLVGLLFAIAVLFYAWGPRDLDVDVEAIVEAPDADARREAVARLWPEGATVAADGRLPEGPALVEAVFRNALRRWFGVLFWFLILGPVGALGYRLVQLSAEGEASRALPGDNADGARWLLSLLDWPVAQLMTLAMALVGNFDSVLTAWKDSGGASFDLDNRFLGASARASVRSELADEAMEYVEEGLAPSGALVRQLGELPELRDAMSLVWRILLLWLAVLALFVIAGFVS
ncbi:MAG TPA: regulatory signaling modulator protein AmpE [Xanthomonadaceae bacterium]|nr:regulatory signaling modulator protein AmpE [Xanthomonadaceae bacterium]